MKIKADTGRCIGAGMCVMTLPEVFDQSEEDGTVVVLAPDPPGELHALVRRAVTLCPSGALSLEETPVSSSNSTG
ncbi:ferredoxin [Thermobispora bispora]|uniref:ferredoxin n=1 Tax=Thermobispora bispora TaxID=2006 RepID=UPI0030E7C9F6|nr:(4Fe-4S)-binding protein [Thermobispora sp.]